MIGSLVRRFSLSRPSGDTRASERAVAVLVGARALLERGWIQGGWYVLQSQDGRRRFVGAGSLTRRSYGEIVAACLVGAVAESARLHSPEPGTAGPAIDALWHALGELEGHAPPADAWPPTPLIRNGHVCDLTRWNDDAARTREDVLRLVDAAVARVRARRVPAQRTPDAVDQISSASIEAALTAPSVGTGR